MGAKAILKSFFEMPFTKGFGPIVDDIDVLFFYSINTAHKLIRNTYFQTQVDISISDTLASCA